MEPDEREEVYARQEYYWGREPSRLARITAEYLPSTPGRLRLLDLGAGEGRDAVFFARQGLDVIALDISPAGLAKAESLATEHDVAIRTIRADVNTFVPAAPIDVVASSGVVQFIQPARRDHQFGALKRTTRSGGLHAIFAFVDHPDIPPPPDTTDDQFPFGRHELQSYYEDWETVHTEEVTFEDDSGGIPHRHAARIHLAMKPDEPAG